MSLFSWRQHGKRRPPARNRRPRVPATAGLCIEYLEDRTLMSVITWTNAAGGDYDVPSNWDAGRVPGAADDAVINMTGITVTHSAAANDSVRSLTSQAAFNLSAGALALGSAASTVNAPLTVGAAATLSLNGTTLGGSGTLNDAGTVVCQINSAVNTTLATQTGSVVRVQATASFSPTLTVAGGFTNNGTIELTNSFNGDRSATLTVTNGTLVNAAGANINSTPGANTAGLRTLNAQLNNQGAVSVTQDLSLNRASAAHVNSGTITVAAGHSLTVNGGSFAPGTGVTGLVNLNSVTVGTGTVASGTTFVLDSCTVDAPATLTNQGTVVTHRDNVVLGSLNNTAGGLLRVEATSAQVNQSLTFLNGFTNNGTIELTNAFNGARNVALAVVNGALVNAQGATINTLPGANTSGTRALSVPLNNQGTLNVSMPTTVNVDSADARNAATGAMNVLANGNLTVSLTGDVPSFTNSGNVAVAAGQSFTVSGGTFNQSAGAVTGAGTLVLSGTSANFTTSVSTAVTGLTVTSSTVNGPGTVTNSANSTLTVTNSTFTAALVNQGTLLSQGNVIFGGAFSNAANATLRVQGVQSFGTSTLSVRDGFTNNGAIELTNAFNGFSNATLTVVNGTLVNAAGGTISTLPGANPNGNRTLAARLDNQGTVTISQVTTLAKPSAVQNNRGTLNVTGANLTVTQSGLIPGFVNTGTITVGGGFTMTVNGGGYTQNAVGAVSGPGTLALSSVVATFNTGVAVGTLALTSSNATFNAGVSVGTLTLTSSTATNAAALSTDQTALALNNSTYNSAAAVTVAASTTATFLNSTVNAPVSLVGTLQAQGTVALNGALTTAASADLEVQGVAPTGATTLTLANGFTNNGAINLTNVFNGFRSVTLAVTGGTLVNAAGATLSSLPGANPAGARALNASFDNRGTVNISQPTTVNQASAAQSNSGTINVTANLTVTQSGTTPSFTNTGTIAVSDGQVLAVSGGSLTQNAPGAVTGNGTLALSSVTATFNTAVAAGALTATSSTVSHTPALSATLSLNSSTYTSPAAVTVVAGATATFFNSTVNAPVSLVGTLQAQGTVALNGALTTAASADLEVQGVAPVGATALTVAGGFTNNGAINLTNIFNGGRNVTLTVTSGTLVNAAGGTVGTLPGANPVGARTLNATLDNQGTVNVGQTVAVSQATNEASGTITVQAGFTLTVSSDFTSAGGVNVSGTFTANSYTQTAGTVTLAGGVLNTVVTLSGGATGGALAGSGTVVGSLVNGGVVNPGGTGAAGVLTVGGDYTQVSGSALNIELGGTDPSLFDQLAIGGAANLAGTLNVSLINGFQPNPANPDSFAILTFSTVNGDFDTKTGLDLGGGNSLVPTYSATALTLVATAGGAPHAGDGQAGAGAVQTSAGGAWLPGLRAEDLDRHFEGAVEGWTLG